MNPVDIDEERLALLQQVKGSFTGFSLTLLSIIQGVALAELASVVAVEYPHFSVVQWLMALVTLFLFVVLWDHLSRDAMTFAWIPDFRDSAIPFLTGVIELFLSHAVGLGIDIWLRGVVAVGACMLAHLSYVHWRVERSAENPHLLAYSRARWRVEWALSIAGLVLFPLLAAGSAAGIFTPGEHARGSHAPLAICAVLLVGAWLTGYVVSTHLSWRATIDRARIDHRLRFRRHLR
ncbi:MAG TPA: hypothetical protein VHB98_17350 [Chloroflexota bacterium]|nr:hypothetical protein [Chloroflexota bacterium]